MSKKIVNKNDIPNQKEIISTSDIPMAITKGVVSSILGAECYVLQNGLPIIAGRGYMRTLSGQENDQKQSGQRLKRMFLHKDIKQFIPKETVARLENPIQFKTLDNKIRDGYDANTLPIVAFALHNAYLEGKINENHTFYKEAKNAGNVIKSFFDVAIAEHIYNITGYSTIKNAEQIKEIFENKFARDLPSDHKRKFEELGLFNYLYKIYNLKRNDEKPWQHPQFFGHIFNKYIYMPLDTILTDGKIQTRGIMKKILSEKKQSGQTLYSFISELGEAKFFGHVGTLTNIIKISKNIQEAEKIFFTFFPQANSKYLADALMLFPLEIQNDVLLFNKTLTTGEQKKSIKKNIGHNDKLSKSIVETIQKDNLDFKENNDFEPILTKIAKTERPT